MLPWMGMQKMCLIDYPGHTSCVLYLGGCNFACPYCHNPGLVAGWEKKEVLPESEILAFLKDRKAWLDAVVITGGEPLLYPELAAFAGKIKSMGFLLKVDTNGANPALLEKMLPLADYIAMDIKSSPAKYRAAANADVDMEKIGQSIRHIMGLAKDYEFRTTVLPEFFEVQDAHEIGKMLKGAKRYVLQQFRPKSTLDPAFAAKKPYSSEALALFRRILSGYCRQVTVRDCAAAPS